MILLLFLFSGCDGGSQQATENKTKQLFDILEKRIDLQITNQSLQQVINRLAEKHSLEIHFSEEKIAAAQISQQQPITLQVNNARLRSAIYLLAEQAGLVVEINNHGVHLTTVAGRDELKITRVYDLNEFIEWKYFRYHDHGIANQTTEEKENHHLGRILADVIEGWTMASGSNFSSADVHYGEGTLVVHHWPSMHEKIRRTIDAIDQFYQPQANQSAVKFELNSRNQISKRIMLALQSTSKIKNFSGTLSDWAEQVRKQHRVNVVISKELKQPEPPAEPNMVSWGETKVLLATQLQNILKHFSATYQIKDDVLFLAAAENVTPPRRGKIFPLKDLYQRLRVVENISPPIELNNLSQAPYALDRLVLNSQPFRIRVADQHDWQTLFGFHENDQLISLPDGLMVFSSREQLDYFSQLLAARDRSVDPQRFFKMKQKRHLWKFGRPRTVSNDSFHSLQDALESRSKGDFQQDQLQLVISKLSKTYRQPIVFHPIWKKKYLNIDTPPVTFSRKKIALRALLYELLLPYGLGVEMQGDALLLSHYQPATSEQSYFKIYLVAKKYLNAKDSSGDFYSRLKKIKTLVHQMRYGEHWPNTLPRVYRLSDGYVYFDDELGQKIFDEAVGFSIEKPYSEMALRSHLEQKYPFLATEQQRKQVQKLYQNSGPHAPEPKG